MGSYMFHIGSYHHHRGWNSWVMDRHRFGSRLEPLCCFHRFEYFHRCQLRYSPHVALFNNHHKDHQCQGRRREENKHHIVFCLKRQGLDSQEMGPHKFGSTLAQLYCFHKFRYCLQHRLKYNQDVSLFNNRHRDHLCPRKRMVNCIHHTKFYLWCRDLDSQENDQHK